MQDPIYNRIEATPRPSLVAANGFVLLAAVGLWLSELILLLLAKVVPVGIGLETLAYYGPFVALPVCLYMGRRPGLSEGMRLNPMPPLSLLIVAMLAYFTVILASEATALWGAALSALGLVQIGSAPVAQTERELALNIVLLAAVPAVCEELLFRGFLLSAWESRGTRFAAGVAVLLFALLHGNLYGLPAYLLVGAISAVLTLSFNSLYAGMAFHLLYNSLCLILPWIVGIAADTAAVEAASLNYLALAVQFLASGVFVASTVALLLRMAPARGFVAIPRIRRPLDTREKLTLLAAVLALLATLVAIQAMAQLGGAV